VTTKLVIRGFIRPGSGTRTSVGLDMRSCFLRTILHLEMLVVTYGAVLSIVYNCNVAYQPPWAARVQSHLPLNWNRGRHLLIQTPSNFRALQLQVFNHRINIVLPATRVPSPGHSSKGWICTIAPHTIRQITYRESRSRESARNYCFF
jgi:hypothetical protein